MHQRTLQWFVLGTSLAMLASVVVVTPWRTSSIGDSHTVLEPGDGSYPVSRIVRYAVTVVNPLGSARRDVTVRVAAPLAQSSLHRTETLRASEPYSMSTDGLGNRDMVFRINAIPPFGRRRIDIRATLSFGISPNAFTGPEPHRFLGAEPRVEIDHPTIRTAAKSFATTRPAKTARLAYDWTAENIRYVSYVREDHGALYALTERRGDCTEGASLFAALARANGISTRRMAGFLADGPRLRGADYHNWAEFHHGGVWWIADPQNRVFARSDHRYVALRILGGDAAHPNDHAIASAPPGITLVMD